MRITEQELAERKRRLLHIAYELFCAKGIDAVPLTEIARKAGVGLSSIYRYYDSKAMLVLHTQKILWEEIVAEIVAGGCEQLNSAKNGWEEIRVLLANFKQLYRHHSGYLLFACDYKLFLVRSHIKLSKEVYDEILAPVCRIFMHALRRGQEDGSISTEESVENQFFAIWGVARGYVEQIVVYGEMYDAHNPWKDRFDLVIKYTLEGLRGRGV